MNGSGSICFKPCKAFLGAAVEGLVVAGCGIAVALAANGMSPRGLSLTRNYFPVPPGVHAVSGRATNGATITQRKIASSAEELVAQQLKDWALQSVDSNGVLELFRSPGREQGRIIFLDARPKEEFESGHIPGAYEFDRYYPSNYLGTVLPACFVAEKIVVYCRSAACDEALLAAVSLRDAGVPNEKLLVYPGGFSEWTANKLAVQPDIRR